jgi:NitT/TauT family transport system substrate-binding protein
MRRYLMIASLIGAAWLLAGPAAAQPAAPAAKTTVKLGISGRPDQAFLELAIRRGYFEQQGLDVQTVQGSSGEEFVSSLAANQLQVASGSPNAGLFNALNRGIDIKLVADFAHVGGAEDRTVAIMVRRDLLESGAVKTVADLKGKTIAAGPGRAQYPDVLYSKIFAAAKMTPADVTITQLNFADSLAAMGSKRIDAAFMVEPLVTQAEAQNIAKVLVPGGAVDSGAELSVVFYSAEFAKQTDAATRFMAAFLHGARDYYDAFFLNKDRDAAIKILTQYLPVKDPKMWENSRQFTDLNGRINVADLKRQAAFYKEQGNITGPVPDIDKFVAPQFAEAAVKSMGER